MMLSSRAQALEPSTTLAIDERARTLSAQGIKIWNFGAGQPDFPTPRIAAAAGEAAIREGKTRYTASNGTAELRRAIAEKLERENGFAVEPKCVLVSNGAKQSLYVLLAAVLDPGDEVIVPAPYWVSYPEQIKLLGGVPRFVRSDEQTGFRMTAEALRSVITPRTRAVILNTPVNPSGAVYPRAELVALAQVIVDHDLLLITDEIYEKILYDRAEHVSAASLGPEVARRTATVHGVSKAYSMTGWRIGYAAGPAEWIEAAGGIQSHLSGNACSISQEAAIAALTGAAAEVAQMVTTFARRRERVLGWLAKANALSICAPQGTFYAFPDVSSLFGAATNGRRIADGNDLATYLLDEARVAIVPGEAFGSPRHLRISFATSDEMIDGGLSALVEALNRLTK
ncbi:MAG: pyridoxal phosphate-dependent aminotransferase [Candidatus Eisenbacteria bacterium]|nr:pyridoxal phosphate-dependent aminotransferase [Candidatus Eisenbacteria bacterium]